MSVPVRKRNISSMQFYTTARDLQRDITLDLIARFNSDLYKSNSQSESGTEITTIEKRNKYIVKHIKHRILKHLEKLIDAISRGNAIYPTTADELNLRKQYQNKAIGSLESLQNDLEYCVDIYPGKLAAMLRYADSIDHEQKLLRRWKQSNNKIKKQIGAASNTTNFCNCNNNGNANNNSANNTNGGVSPDFMPGAQCTEISGSTADIKGDACPAG